MNDFFDCPRRVRMLQGVALLAMSGAACAQVPDAGQALRESAPAQPMRLAPPASVALPPAAVTTADAPSGPSFILNAIQFKGNTVFSDAELQALVRDAIGQPTTFAQLKLLAARITAHYRAANFILTDTMVPAQEIDGGKVEMSVLEGRLGRVRTERLNEVPVPDSVIDAIAAGLPTGRPLTQGELERAVLMLSDMPGMATQASLESGDVAGTYDLVIEAKAAPRTSLSVDVDNQGSRSTGRYRIGALGRINGPFGRGDNLDLRVLNSFGKGLTFGRLSYETPLGPPGLRVSLALGRVQYELGHDFAALDAYGSADVAELALSYPLLRGRLQNLFAKVSLEHKQLNDRIGAVQLDSRKRVQNLGAGLVYERRDQYLGGGFVSGALTAYAGNLAIRSAADLALDQGEFGRHTNGHYARATYSLSRLQYLSPRLSAYLALAGQWSNRNLDSADKIAAGGPRTVRAYPASAGIGDEAQVVNAELRWSVGGDTSLSAFYDAGRVRANRTPYAAETNRQTLSGAGFGLYQNLPSSMALRASVAWPTGHRSDTGAGTINEHGARLYAQLVRIF